ARWTAALRRAAVLALVGAAGVGVYLWLTRAPGSGLVGEAALRAAEAAGCGAIETPVPPDRAVGGLHLDPGQPYTYPRHPATSGYHDPSPLPPEPKVYDRPVPETRAVHNLEHGYVIVYYRAEGDGALPRPVVDRLAGIVEREDEVLLAPYPLLDDGVALAFTAWNKLWECPAGITPSQAATMLEGWIRAYRNSGNAPEPAA
ncbi:MAG TPA: DUF3105 domain-containing protein, partial [Actinomycetota bacterium]|nr:DUF3105 domain-containing protein [Actinomycetota bacterium]